MFCLYEVTILTFTGSADAVEDETGPALAAVRSHQINTAVTVTGVIRTGALINIYRHPQSFLQILLMSSHSTNLITVVSVPTQRVPSAFR